MFIGAGVYTFETEDKIVKFTSNMGPNEVFLMLMLMVKEIFIIYQINLFI